MQHVAEATAHEARIERCAVLGGRGGFRQGRFQRQFRASRFVGGRCWQLGGGRFNIVAGASIGMGQLGKAVNPPVMRHAPGQCTHRRKVTLHFGRQLRQRGRYLTVIDVHIGVRAQRLQVTQQRRQARLAEPGQITLGDPQRMLGAGQSHIQQARILGALLALTLAAGRFPGLVLIQLPVQLALAADVHGAVRGGVRCAAVDADKGQEDQRILQALALVQGDDLHAARIRFQAQQLLLVILVGAGHLSLQPIQQAMHAQRLRRGFLQQFTQLQVIGQAALAIDQRQQALALRGTDIGDHRERTAALPALAPVQQLRLEPALQVTLAFHRRNRTCALAEQYRGQRCAQAAFVSRLQQCQQQRTQIARFSSGKQALLAGCHCRNADRGQRALYQGGLAMRAHQHRDITGLHRASAQHGIARTRLDQDLVDGGHAGLGGRVTRGVGTHRLVTAITQHAQGERRGGMAVALVVRIAAHATGPHRLELDVAFEEGVFAGVVVQRLQRAQHSGSRAEVLVQHRRLLRHLLGLQVSVDITAAETVDRLLGVADQEQRRCQAQLAHLRRIAEHGVEDAPLAIVGILELINQRDAVLRAQLPDQRQSLRAFEGERYAIDQIVVGLHPARALQRLQPLRGVGAKRVQEIQRGSAQPGIAFGQQRDIARQRRLQSG
ncbi:Uncharacterised protein [Stenotrophomonas maltophilia]|nr:Uncharacterised protein [Stenotrophomonas maltophilia]